MQIYPSNVNLLYIKVRPGERGHFRRLGKDVVIWKNT